MGNAQATGKTKATSIKTNETPTYQLVQKVEDPHYGEIKLVRDSKTGEQIYLKEIIFSTREAFKAETNAYNKRIAVSHPNVVRILGCTATDKPNFCSGYFKISVFIEVLPKTLADELAVRLDTGIPFSENDILLIAESLIAALSYFETQNISHGDIRPANIFVTRHSYKLSDPYLNINKNSNALSSAIIGEAQTLLAPQMLKNIPNQDFNIRCNKFKADVFSLGATLLSLASLEKSEELYDYDRGAFDLTLMNNRLETVRKGYSKFTYDMIRSMLRINEDARPDFITLANKFLPYQEDIRRKAELPIFGVRAQYDNTHDEEDYLELQRLLPKIQPHRPDIRQISSQASPIRPSQRSVQSGIRVISQPEDSRPVENVYTVNLEEEEYQYGQDNEPLDFLDRFEDDTYVQGGVNQSPIRYQEQETYYQEPMRKSNSPEKIKRAQPNIEAQYQPEIQQRQHVEYQYLEQRNRVEVQAYYQPEPSVHPQTQSQNKTQIQPPAYTKTQSIPTENRNQVQIPLNNLPTMNTTSSAVPIDDLEAKIREALQRSESTYQFASKTRADISATQKPATQTSYTAQTNYQPSGNVAGDYSYNNPTRTVAYGGQESFGATPTSNLGHAGAIKDRNLNTYPTNLSGVSTNIETQHTPYYQAVNVDKQSTSQNYGYTATSNLSAFGNYGNLEILPSKGANENTYNYGGNDYQYSYQTQDQGLSLGGQRY